MDWNKANTILISAFMILNIFLFTSSNYLAQADYNPNRDEQFVENVTLLLNQKNIEIHADIPEEYLVLPVLETEYAIIQVDENLLENFLDEKIEPLDDVYVYGNRRGESLEIIEGKKLRLTLRDKVQGKIGENLNVKEEIQSFIEDKKIDMEGYVENFKYISESEHIYIYTEEYNNYSMDNSYIHFSVDREGIYRFEMQKIISVTEINEKVRTVHAIEALPRILTYPEIENKKIEKIEMTYYSAEDSNWQNIESINSDPTWKVIFSDGTQKHLPEVN